MRFIPATFMGARGECVKAYSNGSISGSFESGSRIFAYHEFKLSNVTTSADFTFVVEQGYTTDARAIVIGGGGGGGWDGTDSYGVGGGGGGGNVLDSHQVILSPNTYTLRVGAGGTSADADNSSPSLRTYNGGNGDYSTITGPYVSLQANGGQGGIGQRSINEFGFGGQSGAPFDGGRPVSASGGVIAAGGGGGSTSIGFDGSVGSFDRGGAGGSGSVIVLPYTSSTWGVVTKKVGGGGGGSVDTGIGTGVGGTNDYGGGRGSDSQLGSGNSGDRYTGGGGGGGAAYAYTPPNGLGTNGGDGFVIIYYPITDCYNEGSGSFQLANSLFNVCTAPTTTTLYYNKMFYTGLQTGSILYTDRALLSPVSSSYIITGSQVYVISGSNGEITSTTVCSNTISLSSGSASGSACTSVTYNNYYYTGSLVAGTNLYSNYTRTSLVPTNWYKEQSTLNVYNVVSGTITSVNTCDNVGNRWNLFTPSGGSCTYTFTRIDGTICSGSQGGTFSASNTFCTKVGTTPTKSGTGTWTNLATQCINNTCSSI